LLSSVYDGTPLNTSSINVSASTFGSWVIGNLIWLSDAVVLGENTALKPENLVPEFYV
jgi:hypothetical protein